MKLAAILGILLSATLATTASGKWSRLPSVDKKQVSMSTVMSGTTVQSSSGISQAGALVLGDPVKPVKLPNGKSDAILKFVKQSVIESVSFVNDGIEGKVAMSISTDGKVWNPLANDMFTAADRLIKLDAGTAQGRFLRLQFELVRGGLIRGFQALGSDTDANYKVTQNADGSGMPVNFAAGIGGGRLLYISPEMFGSRNDAIRNNQLEFPESDEKYRTAVYDLGQTRNLNEFSSVHSPRPVRFAVYAFDTLPEKEDWRGRLAFDPTVFDKAEPVARGEDAQGRGELVAKPSKVVKCRYVAMRWEPDFNPPSFSAYSVQITGAAVVTFSGAGVSVTTTRNANGTVNATVNAAGGTNLVITINADGSVVVTGSAADANATAPSVDVQDNSGGGTDGGDGGDGGGGGGGGPPTGPGAPSNIGVSLPGSPSQ